MFLFNLKWWFSSFRMHQVFPNLLVQMLFFLNSIGPWPRLQKGRKIPDINHNQTANIVGMNKFLPFYYLNRCLLVLSFKSVPLMSYMHVKLTKHWSAINFSFLNKLDRLMWYNLDF